jgi:hypothetical protein
MRVSYLVQPAYPGEFVNQESVTVNLPASGNQLITQIVSNDLGTVQTSKVITVEDPLPKASISFQKNNVCCNEAEVNTICVPVNSTQKIIPNIKHDNVNCAAVDNCTMDDSAIVLDLTIKSSSIWNSLNNIAYKLYFGISVCGNTVINYQPYYFPDVPISDANAVANTYHIYETIKASLNLIPGIIIDDISEPDIINPATRERKMRITLPRQVFTCLDCDPNLEKIDKSNITPRPNLSFADNYNTALLKPSYAASLNPKNIYIGFELLNKDKNYTSALIQPISVTAPKVTCCPELNNPQLSTVYKVTSPSGVVETIPRTNASNVPLNYVFKEQGKHTVCIEVSNCCGTCIDCLEVYVGDSVSLSRTDCRKFLLSDVQSYVDNCKVEIKVFTPDEQLINTLIIENYSGNSSFNIDLPIDNVYIVSYVVSYIQPITGKEVIVINRKLVLYEFCTVLRCYKEMLTKSLCVPCPDPCSQQENHIVNEAEFHKLNQYLIAASNFVTNILLYENGTNGGFYFDDKYLQFLRETQIGIKRMVDLCNGCGITPIPKSKSYITCNSSNNNGSIFIK